MYEIISLFLALQFIVITIFSLITTQKMLLSGDSKTLGTSTLATTRASTGSVSKPLPKKKDNFIIYSMKRVWSLLSAFWARFRKFMWIGSTGNLFSDKRIHYFGSSIRIFLYARNAKRDDQNDGK